jgi:hypothetical protein
MVNKNILHSEQILLYRELYELEIWKKIDFEDEDSRQDFYFYITSIKRVIHNLLQGNSEKYRKNWKMNWYDFIAENRELLWLPKKIPYETFNIFVQLIQTNQKNIDFDEFLSLLKDKDFFSKSWEISDNMENLINNWGWSDEHAISEIISNAIDVTNPQKVIWRFWKWFFQSCRLIKDEWTKLIVRTKRKWYEPYELILENANPWEKVKDLLFSSKKWKKEIVWTEVEIIKKLSKSEQEKITDYIIENYWVNRDIIVLLNWQDINDLRSYTYINWKSLEIPTEKIEIEVDENWIRVIDYWKWMSSEDLSLKLMYPNKSTQEWAAIPDNKLKQEVEKEVAFYYKSWELKKENKHSETKPEKTRVVLMIWWKVIETIHANTKNSIVDFVLELPSFTYLMEDKGDLTLTKEVILSLEVILDEIKNKITDKKEKLAILEILWIIVDKLKQRPTQTSQSWKYNIDKILKKWFKWLKEELEQSWIKILWWNNLLIEALWEREWIFYVSESIENLDIRKIPWAEKLKNVSWANRQFYTIDFRPWSKISYIITDRWILVDKKYLSSKNTLNVINTLVNLNTNYELESERVYYWTIENWEIFLESEESDLKKEDLTYDNNKDLEYKLDTFLSKLRDFETEYKGFTKDDFDFDKFVWENNINDFLDEKWELTIEFKFYILTLFDFEDVKKCDKWFLLKYLNFIEDASDEVRFNILDFQEYIKKIERKWEYLEKVMNLLENEKTRNIVIGFIEWFLWDFTLIEKIDLFQRDDELWEKRLKYLFEKDIWLFFFNIELELWMKINSINKFEKQDDFYFIDINSTTRILLFFNVWWFAVNCIPLNNNQSYSYFQNENNVYLSIGDEIYLYDLKKQFTSIEDNLIFIWNEKITSYHKIWNKIIFKSISSSRVILYSINIWETQVKEIFSSSSQIFDYTNWDSLIFKSWTNLYYLDDNSDNPIILRDDIDEFNPLFFDWDIIYFLDESSNWQLYSLKIWYENLNNIFNSEYYIDCVSCWDSYVFHTKSSESNIRFYDKNISLLFEIDDFRASYIFSVWNNILLTWSNSDNKNELYIYNYSEKKLTKLIETDLQIDNFQKIDNIIWFSLYDQNNPSNWHFYLMNKNWKLVKFSNNTRLKLKIVNDKLAYLYNNQDIIFIDENLNIVWKYDFSWKHYSSLDNLKSQIWYWSYVFLEYLDKGWEFLEEKSLEEWFVGLRKSFKLSELMFLNKLRKRDLDESLLSPDIKTSIQNLFEKIDSEEKRLTIYEDKIRSQVLGQDKWNQIWLRELVQNSRDALLKSQDVKKEINIEFYQNDWNFVSSIEDPVWMTLEEVFKY